MNPTKNRGWTRVLQFLLHCSPRKIRVDYNYRDFNNKNRDSFNDHLDTSNKLMNKYNATISNYGRFKQWSLKIPKEVIRSRKSKKDRQRNGQKKEDKQRSTKYYTIKKKDNTITKRKRAKWQTTNYCDTLSNKRPACLLLSFVFFHSMHLKTRVNIAVMHIIKNMVMNVLTVNFVN